MGGLSFDPGGYRQQERSTELAKLKKEFRAEKEVTMNDRLVLAQFLTQFRLCQKTVAITSYHSRRYEAGRVAVQVSGLPIDSSD